eukprot:c24667_g1_i1 orf=404-1477(+)
MATSVQNRSATRGARNQSLFYRDLSSSPATRSSVLKGGLDTPGKASAGVAFWRENLGAADLPPPPIYTLDDRIENSPSKAIGESSIRSPESKFDEVKSPTRTHFTGVSNRSPLGFTPWDASPGYTFGSPSSQNSQQYRSLGGSNMWSPSKERHGLDFRTGRGTENDGGSPVSGVVQQQQQQSGGLLTLPTLREIVRPEFQWSRSPDDNVAEGDEWVTVFGFGANETNAVLREFEKCGTIVRHVPGPGGANWVHIQFQHRYDAQKALQKNGMQINGAMIVGVKPIDLVQREALTEKIQRTGFMVLPARSPGKGPPSTLVRSSVRPYYLEQIEAGRAAGPIASPSKSTLSKLVDLVFGK